MRLLVLFGSGSGRLCAVLFALLVAAMPGRAASAASAQGLPDFVDPIEKVAPAVVNIRTTERADEGARQPSRFADSCRSRLAARRHAAKARASSSGPTATS